MLVVMEGSQMSEVGERKAKRWKSVAYYLRRYSSRAAGEEVQVGGLVSGRGVHRHQITTGYPPQESRESHRPLLTESYC